VKTKRERSPRREIGKGWGRYLLLFILFVSPSLVAAQEAILTLEQAIQLALTGNERALYADQRVTAADARVTKARAFFMPVVSASGTYTRRPFEVQRTIGSQQIIVQNLNALSGVASLSMTIFDSKSIPGLIQASSDRSSELYAAAADKRALAFEVSNAFLMTLSVDQVLEASRRRFDFAKQNLDAAKARYAAGLVSSNDVTRAELEAATAEMGVTQVQGQVETTYLQLGYLLNSPGRKKLKAPEFLARAVEEKLQAIEALIAEAQARRPDVVSLRWHARSVHAQVVEPVLRWLPTLTLTGRYTYTNEAGLTGKNFNWNAALNLSWSIFDGFTRNGDYSERRALAYQADLDLQSALRRVELEVRDALVTLDNERAALKQATVAQEVAKRNAGETAELYRQGLSSALQVADANVRLFEAEVQLVSSRYGVAIAYMNLEAALGLDPFGKEPKIEY